MRPLSEKKESAHLSQLMIYEAAVPVSHTRHLNWSVEVGTDYAFCRNVNAVPLMAAEFASAACEYAIVLGGTVDVVRAAQDTLGRCARSIGEVGLQGRMGRFLVHR